MPTILFGFGWIIFGTVDGLWRGAGLLSVILALLTLFAHARVYVAVPTVAAWHNRWVVLNFIAMGLLAGALWLNVLVHVFATSNPQIALLSVVAIFFVFYVKRGHWREVDTVASQTSSGRHRPGRRPGRRPTLVLPAAGADTPAAAIRIHYY